MSDEKTLTFTIMSDEVGGYAASPALATGGLTLRATDAASAQKTLDLLRAVAPAFAHPTMTATIRISALSTTYKIEDAAPELSAQWIDEVAAPMAQAPQAAPNNAAEPAKVGA